jgi:hypothetical protein
MGLEPEFARLENDALQTLHSVMLGGENESARVKAATYVMDQRLGLKKPQRNITFNIAELNLKLRQARESINKTIDVPSTKVLVAA